MIKLTKRKGFNFFRSYYDVYNELGDNDKVAFIDALLDKQFLGVDPDLLTGQAKFAWISQMHSIDQQVKGYQDKTGDILTPLASPLATPLATPLARGEITPTLQVQVQVEEKVKEQLRDFLSFWNLYNKKNDKKKVEAKWSKLKDSDKKMILLKLPAYIKSTPEIKYRKNPLTYLNGESWNDEIESKPENKSFSMGGSQNTASQEQVQKEIQEIKNGYERLKNNQGPQPKYESPIKKRLQSIKPK
jgi:hypothetical protein